MSFCRYRRVFVTSYKLHTPLSHSVAHTLTHSTPQFVFAVCLASGQRATRYLRGLFLGLGALRNLQKVIRRVPSCGSVEPPVRTPPVRTGGGNLRPLVPPF